jgi:hypothetical protein
MAIDVFPCEDGHAQERALLGQVLATVKPGDVWIMDRNFCVRDFLCGIEDGKAYGCGSFKTTLRHSKLTGSGRNRKDTTHSS